MSKILILIIPASMIAWVVYKSLAALELIKQVLMTGL